MRRATECAGYPSQLAAVRAMALAGVGRAEIRQRTGLDSHRVGSLLAKVRAEERRGAPPVDVAPPALADTESDGEVHLRSWDGKRLHVNGRVLTRIPRFYWRGSREAAEALRRKLPAAWGALSMVPAWRVL